MNADEKLLLGYQEALLQLREHPKLVWMRNNFFLLTQTGLLAFALNADKQASVNTGVMTCVAGLFLALIWLWVNWAGRNLQRQWRKIVVEFEKQLFEGGDAERQVKGPFHLAAEFGEGNHFSLSITLALLILSAGFIVVWIILLYQICAR